jgi:hypothetical protein
LPRFGIPKFQPLQVGVTIPVGGRATIPIGISEVLGGWLARRIKITFQIRLGGAIQEWIAGGGQPFPIRIAGGQVGIGIAGEIKIRFAGFGQVQLVQ